LRRTTLTEKTSGPAPPSKSATTPSNASILALGSSTTPALLASQPRNSSSQISQDALRTPPSSASPLTPNPPHDPRMPRCRPTYIWPPPAPYTR
jgi:hypothetical protein